jgi:hypothetical protein
MSGRIWPSWLLESLVKVEGVYRLELRLSEAGRAAHVKVAFVERDRIRN